MQRPNAANRAEPSRAERAALLLRDWMRASNRGPVSFAWRTCYASLRTAVTCGLWLAGPGSTIFARGTLGEGRPLYGYSDLDFVAAAPDAECALRLRRRVDRVLRRLPLMRHAVDIAVTTRTELERPSTVPYVCLPAPAGRVDGPRLPRGFGISFIGRTRPWRRLGGPRAEDLQPVPPEFRLQWMWAETQFRWKHVIRALIGDGDLLQAAHVASSALVGLAQAMAWAASGEEPTPPEAAIVEASAAAPEHVAVLEAALNHCSGSRPPESQTVLPAVSALTHLIAGRIIDAAGVQTSVRLVGAAEAMAPLLDWRSMVFPYDDQELFSAKTGSLSDLTLLRAIASDDARARTALLDGRVMLLPLQPGSPADRIAAQAWVMRSVQCAVSDPVSWALARGESIAVFWDLPGWSLADWTERSAAELSLRLAEQAFEAAGQPRRRARLTSAARLLALRESMAEGRPALRVSASAVTGWLKQAGLPAIWLERHASEAELESSRRALAGELAAQAIPMRSV